MSERCACSVVTIISPSYRTLYVHAIAVDSLGEEHGDGMEHVRGEIGRNVDPVTISISCRYFLAPSGR